MSSVQGEEVGLIPVSCGEAVTSLYDDTFVLETFIAHGSPSLDTMCDVLSEMEGKNRKDVTFVLTADFEMEDVDEVRSVQDAEIAILDVDSRFVGDKKDEFALCGNFTLGFDLSNSDIKELRDDLVGLSLDNSWDTEDVSLKIHQFGAKKDQNEIPQNPIEAMTMAEESGEMPEGMEDLARALLE